MFSALGLIGAMQFREPLVCAFNAILASSLGLNVILTLYVIIALAGSQAGIQPVSFIFLGYAVSSGFRLRRVIRSVNSSNGIPGCCNNLFTGDSSVGALG